MVLSLNSSSSASPCSSTSILRLSCSSVSRFIRPAFSCVSRQRFLLTNKKQIKCNLVISFCSIHPYHQILRGNNSITQIGGVGPGVRSCEIRWSHFEFHKLPAHNIHNALLPTLKQVFSLYLSKICDCPTPQNVNPYSTMIDFMRQKMIDVIL